MNAPVMRRLKGRYKHNCSGCEFVGMVGEFDILVHKGHDGKAGALVARYGDDPKDVLKPRMSSRASCYGVWLDDIVVGIPAKGASSHD